MAKANHQIELSLQWMIDSIEIAIRENEKMFTKFYTKKKTKDFKPGDIVKCLYLKDFLQVLGLTPNNKVSLKYFGKNEDSFQASPEFLKKVVASNKMLKVLYGS